MSKSKAFIDDDPDMLEQTDRRSLCRRHRCILSGQYQPGPRPRVVQRRELGVRPGYYVVCHLVDPRIEDRQLRKERRAQH